jgi:hypothetical protein
MKIKSIIVALLVGFASIAAVAEPLQLHVEIHLPALIKTSGNPAGYDVPLSALTYNNHLAIDPGGQQTARANDINTFWFVQRVKRLKLQARIGFELAFSSFREAYLIASSTDLNNAIAPIVGSNLANSFRPPGTYDDDYPWKSYSWCDGSRVAWRYGTSPGIWDAIGLYTESEISNVVRVGDSVPERASPTRSNAGTTIDSLHGGAGTTINSLAAVAIAPDYVAFAASGSGFTGAYARKISDGVMRTVAENFASNQYGSIYSVAMHGDRDVIFSANGFYKGDAEGATEPTLITSAIGGTLTDVDGDFAGVMGFDSGYKVWKLNLLNGTFQTIVQQGDPRPGGGIFSVVQRPGISPDMVVFEGFDENFTYIGIFAWVNGTILPIVRKNDMLDGKIVQFPAFEPGAVDDNLMGFVAHFTDGTAGAYLASVGITDVTAAVSRKTHGSAGTFDINLPVTGSPGVECRTGGASGNHTLVVGFSHSVVSGSASVTSGTGSVVGGPTFDANTMTVQLTGVANAQTVAVSLNNVTDDIGGVLPNKVVNVNFLVGDTTANKSVNASDVAQTKSRSGSAVTLSTFRNDVTATGSINSSDVALVKTRSGTAVP